MYLQLFGAPFGLVTLLGIGSNAKSVDARIAFGCYRVALCLLFLVSVSVKLFALCGFLFGSLRAVM